jgi:hypothetical protein
MCPVRSVTYVSDRSHETRQQHEEERIGSRQQPFEVAYPLHRCSHIAQAAGYFRLAVLTAHAAEVSGNWRF